jgi:hypothetical protein
MIFFTVPLLKFSRYTIVGKFDPEPTNVPAVGKGSLVKYV